MWICWVYIIVYVLRSRRRIAVEIASSMFCRGLVWYISYILVELLLKCVMWFATNAIFHFSSSVRAMELYKPRTPQKHWTKKFLRSAPALPPNNSHTSSLFLEGRVKRPKQMYVRALFTGCPARVQRHELNTFRHKWIRCKFTLCSVWTKSDYGIVRAQGIYRLFA